MGVWRSVDPATTGEPTPLPCSFCPPAPPHSRYSLQGLSRSGRLLCLIISHVCRKRCRPTITRLSNCKAVMCRLRCWSGQWTMTSRLSWLVRLAFVPADALVEPVMAGFTSAQYRAATGSRKAKGGKMIVKKAVPGEWGIGSTADAMLQITKLPLLVVQPDAVRSLGRANLRTQSTPDDQVRCCSEVSHVLTSLLSGRTSCHALCCRRIIY